MGQLELRQSKGGQFNSGQPSLIDVRFGNFINCLRWDTSSWDSLIWFRLFFITPAFENTKNCLILKIIQIELGQFDLLFLLPLYLTISNNGCSSRDRLSIIDFCPNSYRSFFSISGIKSSELGQIIDNRLLSQLVPVLLQYFRNKTHDIDAFYSEILANYGFIIRKL